jgi:hypothetical protein
MVGNIVAIVLLGLLLVVGLGSAGINRLGGGT